MAEVGNNLSVLRHASCALASSKQRQVTLEEVSWSVRFGCLADLRFVKTVHGKDSMLFVCSLCSLPPSQPIHNAQPHPRCSVRHKEGAGTGSTSSSAVPLTTNDMESRAAQAFATTTDWQSSGVSNRRSTHRLDRRHAQEFV